MAGGAAPSDALLTSGAPAFPQPLHWAEQKEAIGDSAALFTSRTRYALLSAHLSSPALRGAEAEGRPHLSSFAEAENARMQRMQRTQQQQQNEKAEHHLHTHMQPQQQSQHPWLREGEAHSVMIRAVRVDAAARSATTAAPLSGDALLSAMARLLRSAKDARDDRGGGGGSGGGVGGAAMRSAAVGSGAGAIGRASNFARSAAATAAPAEVPHATPPLGHALPLPTAALSPRPSSSASAAATSASAAPSVALLEGEGAEAEAAASVFNAATSVRALLELYRSNPIARAALQSRVDAEHERLRGTRGGARVAQNARQAGEAELHRRSVHDAREKEKQRQAAAHERRTAQQRTREEEDNAQRSPALAASAAAESMLDGAAQPGEFGAARSEAAGGAVAFDGADDGSDASESADARRRALLTWAALLPALSARRLWVERAKDALLPRLRAEWESAVDVDVSSLLHSALTARLSESKDAALIVLKRSLATYGLRWQWQRRRRAAVLLLTFLSLVRTAANIRQALRDSSVLSRILTLQRWWRRHRKAFDAQKTVLAKKWRRREALRSKQHAAQQQAQAPTSGPPTSAGIAHLLSDPGGGGGLGAGAGAGAGDSGRGERRRPPSSDAQHAHSAGSARRPESRARSAAGLPAMGSVDVSSVYKALPRAAQWAAVAHLLAERRAQHRRRLRAFFAASDAYCAEHAQALELVRTRRMLGMDGAAADAAPSHTHPSLPPAPARPRFRLLPPSAEMDDYISAASRAYFLSRLDTPDPVGRLSRAGSAAQQQQQQLQLQQAHSRPATSWLRAASPLSTVNERVEYAARGPLDFAVDFSAAFAALGNNSRGRSASAASRSSQEEGTRTDADTSVAGEMNSP